MKKLSLVLLFVSILCSPVTSYAQEQNIEESDPAFVMIDVLLYRPVSLAVTVAGTAVFVALTPLTALASIPAPHDALAKTSKILVLAPAAYTFLRPIGNRDFPYYPPGYQHKTTPSLSDNPTLQPSSPLQ
ncbi:MAG: hypothetical protein HOP34_02650 [Methylococcaceae bacterium]|nr:hypothetical protein [Methylococcaceae bacterium]